MNINAVHNIFAMIIPVQLLSCSLRYSKEGKMRQRSRKTLYFADHDRKISHDCGRDQETEWETISVEVINGQKLV
jgi:hypothetical protein